MWYESNSLKCMVLVKFILIAAAYHHSCIKCIASNHVYSFCTISFIQIPRAKNSCRSNRQSSPKRSRTPSRKDPSRPSTSSQRPALTLVKKVGRTMLFPANNYIVDYYASALGVDWKHLHQTSRPPWPQHLYLEFVGRVPRIARYEQTRVNGVTRRVGDFKTEILLLWKL